MSKPRHGLEQLSDAGVGDSVITMAALSNHLKKLTLCQSRQMGARSLAGNSGSLCQFSGRQAAPIKKSHQYPASGRLAD